VLRNADHAFDAADDATDNTAHDATHHGADRPSMAMTYGRAMLTSSDNALRLCSNGR
jgi:hypothetical protein